MFLTFRFLFFNQSGVLPAFGGSRYGKRVKTGTLFSLTPRDERDKSRFGRFRRIVTRRVLPDFPKTHSSDAGFKVWLTHYEYDKNPLNAKTIETRYKTLVFESAGLEKDFLTRINETSPIKFASQIKTQKLVINGRYDATFPLNTDAKPLFKFLREPKKIALYDGGHIPSVDFFVPTVNHWLDETLGIVAE